LGFGLSNTAKSVLDFHDMKFGRSRIDEAVSVRNLQFKNARKEMFEIVHFAHTKSASPALSQVVCVELTKRLRVEQLLIVGTMATRACVRVRAKRICHKDLIQALWYRNGDGASVLEVDKDKYVAFMDWLQSLSGVKWIDVAKEAELALSTIQKHAGGSFPVTIGHPFRQRPCLPSQ
jgi:hypothetical protein